MKTVKVVIQYIIMLLSAIFGGAYVASISGCMACTNISGAEVIGIIAIFFLVTAVILAFWLWLFTPDKPDEEEKESK